MGFYTQHILPYCAHCVLGAPCFDRLRPRATLGLYGRVLELGFGSGLNLRHYPPEVSQVLALEPVPLARRLSARRLRAARLAVEFVGVDAAEIPLPDQSVDCVLSTWTLCSISKVEQALTEVRRVLRVGGALHYLEHGASPEPGVLRWQQRLSPLQQRLAGGCHLERAIETLIENSGLRLLEREQFALRAPAPFAWHYLGRAERAKGAPSSRG